MISQTVQALCQTSKVAIKAWKAVELAKYHYEYVTGPIVIVGSIFAGFIVVVALGVFLMFTVDHFYDKKE